MILYGTNIYTEIDFNSDGVSPDKNSIASITSSNYFESLIENCIQFFDEEYLFGVPWFAAYEDELHRILDHPDQTNNLGRLIYTLYYSALSKGREERAIKTFIYENFFNHCESRSLYNLYKNKQSSMKLLSDRLGVGLYEYDKITNIIDTNITGVNYDFSKVGIHCMVYRNEAFNIKPSALYQVAMSYNGIVLTHNVPNKEYWEINPVTIDGIVYTNLEDCINSMNERKVLVLCCNDDGHIIKNIPSKTITLPKHSLISELYIEN